MPRKGTSNGVEHNLQGRGGTLRPEHRDPIGNRHPWFAVGTVCVGALMAALDASIMNIALPTLRRSFGMSSIGEISWVSLIYLVTLAAVIVPFGRFADLFGRRWMYALGFVVFVAGSLLCGLSTSFAWLLVFRVLQAIGAGMLQANSVSIVTAVAPSGSRGRAIGIQASAQGVGLSLGPALGGFLLTYLNWRWIFFINVPIGLIGTVLALFILPRDKPVRNGERFDTPGALVLASTLVAWVYFLNSGWNFVGTHPLLWLVLLVGVAGIWVFVRLGQKVDDPLIDLSLFRLSSFRLGNVTGVLSFMVMYAVMLLTPFELESVGGISTAHAGVLLTAIPVGMTVFTPIAGYLSDRFGARLPLLAGMGLSLAGALLLAWNGVDERVVVAGLFLVGTGIGLFTPPNNASVMTVVPAERLGIAGGMLNMARTLGMSLGVSLGAVSLEGLSKVIADFVPAIDVWRRTVVTFHFAYLMAAVVALVTLGLMAVQYRAPNIRRDQRGGEG